MELESTNFSTEPKDTPPAKQPIAPKKKFKVRKKFSPTRFGIAIGVLVVIAAALSAVYFYKQYTDLKANPTQAVEQRNSQEAKDVVASLGKILLLDAKTEPTIARVENPEALKKNNPEFYVNIQKDDYLILYPNRAIIYRQEINQVINVAPIVTTDSTKTE